MTFIWQGPQLEAGLGYEIRLWQAGDPYHYGAASTDEVMQRVTRRDDGAFTVSLDIRSAYSVQLHGSGDYFWSIAVVVMDPYEPLGTEATQRTLIINIGGGPHGGPQPTDTPPPS